ncbi:hypothetical protein IFM89_033800 [Coptis chinensis]|uniref:Uncharacterized protein n=1 Tax=Coptis chinensis TaxID=261450 RepID=A0A835HP33_9MAGN|nr:hypothetical protein IFM89_033800 [Coptis chinensis]
MKPSRLLYVDAENAYKKISPKGVSVVSPKCLYILSHVIESLSVMEIGELYETEQDLLQPIAYLERAADIFSSEEVTLTQTKGIIWVSTSPKTCPKGTQMPHTQVSGLQCISCIYAKAVEIYEEIARHSLNNNLLKYSVKGYLLNLWSLANSVKGDAIAITNALEKYQNFKFEKCAKNLVGYYGDGCEESYGMLVYTFPSCSQDIVFGLRTKEMLSLPKSSFVLIGILEALGLLCWDVSLEAKILVVKDVERDAIEFITKTLNCLPIANIEHFREEKMGRADCVEEVSLGDGGKIVKITGIKDMGRTTTVLVRGSNRLVPDEAERSLHDALCVIRCLVTKKFLILWWWSPGNRFVRGSLVLGLRFEPNSYRVSSNRHAVVRSIIEINVRKGQITNILENVVHHRL